MSGRRDLWGGRFSGRTGGGPPPVQRLVRRSTARSSPRTSRGSIAWAEALGRCGVLTARRGAEDRRRACAAVEAAWDAGEGRDADAEDVHSYVEGELAKRVGPLAGKLHTGRSRNDQVATDLRLWLTERVRRRSRRGPRPRRGARGAGGGRGRDADARLHAPEARRAGDVRALVPRVRRDAPARRGPRPRGAPPRERVPARLGRPLGDAPSGRPRAGSRRASASPAPTANSLDGVSDRDAAAEYLFAASLLLAHLSRLAEDLIFFTSDEAGFAELPDALATGSSRMPQKKNPDLLELVRGHAGRAIGELTGLLAVLKGLPLAYDKDLQLDKEPLFRTRAVLEAALPALTALVAGLRLKADRMRAAASDDRLLATELADALARRGVPFREAHEIVGRRFALAEATGTGLAELPPGDGITPERPRVDRPRQGARVAARPPEGLPRSGSRRSGAERPRRRIAAEEEGVDEPAEGIPRLGRAGGPSQEARPRRGAPRRRRTGRTPRPSSRGTASRRRRSRSRGPR